MPGFGLARGRGDRRASVRRLIRRSRSTYGDGIRQPGTSGGRERSRRREVGRWRRPRSGLRLLRSMRRPLLLAGVVPFSGLMTRFRPLGREDFGEGLERPRVPCGLGGRATVFDGAMDAPAREDRPRRLRLRVHRSCEGLLASPSGRPSRARRGRTPGSRRTGGFPRSARRQTSRRRRRPGHRRRSRTWRCRNRGAWPRR